MIARAIRWLARGYKAPPWRCQKCNAICNDIKRPRKCPRCGGRLIQ